MSGGWLKKGVMHTDDFDTPRRSHGRVFCPFIGSSVTGAGNHARAGARNRQVVRGKIVSVAKNLRPLSNHDITHLP